MSNNQRQHSAPSPAPHKPAKAKTERRGFGTWFIRNGALLIVAGVLISKVPGLNQSYQWLWEGYLKSNLEAIKQYPDLSTDEKMAMKLGADYQYLAYLRDNTPKDAVIYWPSAGDFRSAPDSTQQTPFNGKLNDKLTAVRVLYPRRVVTENEYGKTSWSKKLTYIGIVNGHNTDKVHYPVPPQYTIGVLPVNAPQNMKQP